jgi:hypothetical protein
MGVRPHWIPLPCDPSSFTVNDRVPKQRSMSRKLSRLLRRVRGPVLPLGDRLIVCAVCGSSVVNPVDWDENGALHWWVRLRCGECAWSREVIITDDEANQLDRDLELGLRDIAGVVERLDRERMVREADSFITALRHDLIGPSDVAHRLPR